MIPENITKLVDKALFEAWFAGRTGESRSRAVRLARPILPTPDSSGTEGGGHD